MSQLVQVKFVGAWSYSLLMLSSLECRETGQRIYTRQVLVILCCVVLLVAGCFV